MNIIKIIARKLVERDIRKELGGDLALDACWFDKDSPEYKAVYQIGEQLKVLGFYSIQRIREDNKLTSPERPYKKCVVRYPNGQIMTSMDSSDETHKVIAKAFERTMPQRIWDSI